MLTCFDVHILKQEITFACEIKGISLASEIWRGACSRTFLICNIPMTLLQDTHVLFLASYHQQCQSFLKALYGLLGWICGKRPGELQTCETLTVISGLFKYSLTCQHRTVEIPNKY